MNKKVTEIVCMQKQPTITNQEFERIIDDLELLFHTQQEGFIDTELLFDEKEEIWIMIQHWESLDHMKASSANMFKDSATEIFRKAVDPKTIKISVYPILSTW